MTQLKVTLRKFVASKYKWFVLAGTVMISISPGIREHSEESARRFSEALEDTVRYRDLRHSLSNLERDLLELKATTGHSDTKVNPVSSLLANEAWIRMILTYNNAAERTLQDSELLLKLVEGIPSARFEDQSMELQTEAERISRELDAAVAIAANNTSEVKLVEQWKRIEKLLPRVQAVYNKAGQLHVTIFAWLQDRRASLFIRALMLNVLSYVLFALGLVFVVGGQWIIRPGEAPDLHLE